MRLYLSSYRLGDESSELIRLAGANANGALILNACDAISFEARAERLKREFTDLEGLGFTVTEIDLRDYFDKAFTAQELDAYDLLWVRGGNVFNLLRAMRLSGFDKIITEMLKNDSIAYGGYSAGVCVLGPTLHGVELCDPIEEIPAGYPTEIEWDGLGILPYSVTPHYKSDHPESAMIDDVVAYYEEHKMPYKALRDGEVIIVDGKIGSLIQ